MIKAYCRTNLDEYKNQEWPSNFIVLPRIGDKIQSKNGKRLEVVAVTFLYNDNGQGYDTEIELHKRNG